VESFVVKDGEMSLPEGYNLFEGLTEPVTCDVDRCGCVYVANEHNLGLIEAYKRAIYARTT
jgi:hypothetical protein